jgi:hypothetical protein
MTEAPPRRVDDWAALWSKLIGPVLVCFLGCFGLIYEMTAGHDATFGTISAGLAAAGASLSADITGRHLRKAA